MRLPPFPSANLSIHGLEQRFDLIYLFITKWQQIVSSWLLLSGQQAAGPALVTHRIGTMLRGGSQSATYQWHFQVFVECYKILFSLFLYFFVGRRGCMWIWAGACVYVCTHVNAYT